MPWGALVQVGAQLLDLFLKEGERRNRLKMQMFEFAKQFDENAIDRNARLREEYRRMKSDLDKKT